MDGEINSDAFSIARFCWPMVGVMLLLFTMAACADKDEPDKENGSDSSVITTPEATNIPVFASFTYVGNDAVYRTNLLAADEFYTPILQGCYPDPSITRKGDDYYLVNSSFSFYPGIPIFHSTDLVNWKQIGHVMDRQLKLTGLPMNYGVYAPDIAYNSNNDIFYVLTTHIGGNLGNIVMKTKNPAGPWSDAIKLSFDGIDPAMFFDDDGKAYIVHNGDPDVNVYGSAHKAVRMIQYDLVNDKVVGEDKELVSGGVNIADKPSWIEGPHLYKKNGCYYLMCAEGGTGPNHREVIFRSDNVWGPYAPSPVNPILTQKDLPYVRENKVDATGHADLVQTPSGQYYGVFLAVRPNKNGTSPMGRETFILPVDWSGDFPVFTGGLEALAPKLKMPTGVINKAGTDGYISNGNFTFTDTFKDGKLGMEWLSIRGPYDFVIFNSNGLQIIPANVRINESTTAPSTVCFRQKHNSYIATTVIRYKPEITGDLAGIACFYNENHNYVFGITYKDNNCYIVLEKTDNGVSTKMASQRISSPVTVLLRVRAEDNDYYFEYSMENDGNFINLGGKMSGNILHAGYAGGFTGNTIALYATKANAIVP